MTIMEVRLGKNVKAKSFLTLKKKIQGRDIKERYPNLEHEPVVTILISKTWINDLRLDSTNLCVPLASV